MTPSRWTSPSLALVLASILSGCSHDGSPTALCVFAFEGGFGSAFDAHDVLGGLSAPIPFSGTYAYDATIPDTDPDPDEGSYVSTSPGSGFSVSFDGFTVGGTTLGVTTSNEPPGNAADILSIRAAGAGTAGFPAGWDFQLLIDFAEGSPADLLTSDHLPVTAPDLADPDLDSKTFQIVGAPTGGSLGALNLSGSLTSLALQASCRAGKDDDDDADGSGTTS